MHKELDPPDGTALVAHGLAEVGTIDRHAEISPATREFVKRSKAERTRALYTQQWGLFANWCESSGCSALPALPETVADYLRFLALTGPHGRPWKPGTIELALSVISKRHRVARLPSPRDDELVQLTLEGIKRTLGTSKRRVDAAVPKVLRRFSEVLPDTLLGKRDQALLAVGFAGAFRRSELVALDVADLRFEDEGPFIQVRRSKTDQVAAGKATALPYGSSPATCSIRTLRRWLDASGITEGAVPR